MKLLLAIRSLLFYIGYAPLVALFSLLSCTIGYLLPLPWRQSLATCGNLLIDHWLRLSCGIRVRVIGRENLPARPFVVLSNHQSPWETYYLQRHLRPVSTILKKELLKVPFFGWGLASVKPIAIDRSNPRKAIREVMEQGQERLAAGMNVIVFPEGTRIPYGQYGDYARSGAALACEARVPVVPVAHNGGRHWPARRFLKYPGTLTIVFGQPIATADRTSKDVTAEAERWIKQQQKGLASE
ncbi:MAG: lysophospholipid acyltransferase family protein [Porticoccaceae bacterium]